MINPRIPETGASQQQPMSAGKINSSMESLNASLHSTKEQHGVAQKSLGEFSVQTLVDENYAAVKEFVKDPQLLEAYGNDVRKLTDEHNNKMQTLTEEYSQYEKDLETLEKGVNAIDTKESDAQAKINDLQYQLELLGMKMGACKEKIGHTAEMYQLSLTSVKWGYVTKELSENATQQPPEAKRKTDMAINAKIYDSIVAADKFINEFDANRKHAKQKQERRHRIKGSTASKTGIGTEMNEQRQLHDRIHSRRGKATPDTEIELQRKKRVANADHGQERRKRRRAKHAELLEEINAEIERVKEEMRLHKLSEDSPKEQRQNEQHKADAVKPGDVTIDASDAYN